jgi:predicted ArsR family transcriptional regulator
VGRQAKARQVRRTLQNRINTEQLSVEQAQRLYRAFKREGYVTYVRKVDESAGVVTLETLK